MMAEPLQKAIQTAKKNAPLPLRLFFFLHREKCLTNKLQKALRPKIGHLGSGTL